MKTYVQVDFTILDPDQFMTYVERIPALIEKHGGRYLVRGVEPSVVKQDAEVLARNVILEFPSREAVDAFLEERNAAGLMTLWEKTTRSRILVLDGI